MGAGLARRRAPRTRGRRGRAHLGARRDPRRLRDRLPRGPGRRPSSPEPAREARRAVRRRGARDRRGSPRRARHERRARRRDRALLAGRDHERVQPARQHGRPRGDARGDRVRLLRDRRRDGARERPRARALAVPRVRLRRLPAVQPPADRRRACVHGRRRQSAARVPARRACARIELDDDRSDGRDDPAAAARARDPDPRHDARHGPATRRAPPGHPGREGPFLAPARLLRALRDPCRRAPRSHRHCSRCDVGRVQRARPSGDHRPGRPRHLRAPRPVRELPRRALRGREARPPRRHEAPARDRRPATAAPRAARRRHPRRGNVPRRLPPARRRPRHRTATRDVPGRAPDPARHDVRRLRARGGLSPCLAPRHAPRPGDDRARLRARDARRVPDRRRDARPR